MFDLGRFSPITLGEMDSIRLMNRIDSKYVTDMATLEGVLEDALSNGYRILDNSGNRLNSYDTIYYDTPERSMYLDHHNKRLTRQKVRTRTYLTSGASFLEIKLKNNKGRTKKKRYPIPLSLMEDFRPDCSATAFLRKYSEYEVETLSPSLRTTFSRMTLVNRAETERLTIDTSVRFHSFRTGKDSSLGRGVVIELKQDGRSASEMKDILLSHRIHELRISKYCIGTVLTDPTVKSNRFKMKIRMIEKATGDNLY